MAHIDVVVPHVFLAPCVITTRALQLCSESEKAALSKVIIEFFH